MSWGTQESAQPNLAKDNWKVLGWSRNKVTSLPLWCRHSINLSVICISCLPSTAPDTAYQPPCLSLCFSPSSLEASTYTWLISSEILRDPAASLRPYVLFANSLVLSLMGSCGQSTIWPTWNPGPTPITSRDEGKSPIMAAYEQQLVNWVVFPGRKLRVSRHHNWPASRTVPIFQTPYA